MADEKEVDLTEEDQRLLILYNKLKKDHIIMMDGGTNNQQNMYVQLTLEDLIRLSKLIENDR